MKEYWNLITRPEGISDKDYAAMLWTELAVVMLVILGGIAKGYELAMLIGNAVISIAYCIKFIDWSKLEE